MVTAIGVGFISFSAYAAKNHIGPALLAPTPGTFDWYLIHDEDRAGKVVSCYLASPDVKPQMDCGPAEKAKAQVDRENSDRETEALLKRQ